MEIRAPSPAQPIGSSFPSLEFYRRVVMERFFPSLSDEAITEKSNQVEKEVFERMGQSV
jgi:hypothetical protein